jgi:hypothetical protein
MYLTWDEIPQSRGHAFYDRLQQILRKSGFDAFAEKLCKSFYSDKGRPSISPGSLRQTCGVQGRRTFPVLVDAMAAAFQSRSPNLGWIQALLTS